MLSHNFRVALLTNYNFSFHQIKNSPNLQNVISAFLCYPIIFSTKQNLHHHEEKRGERSKVLSQRKKKHGKRLLANIARKPKMMALNTVEVALLESLRRKAVAAALEERINISPCNYKQFMKCIFWFRSFLSKIPLTLFY